MTDHSFFSDQLEKKISLLKKKMPKAQLGALSCPSPLWLAPMAGICTPNFRLLMEKLGAGMTVSELVSAHGINHGNERTLHMLTIDPEEKNVGLQLFGEDAEAMAMAAKVAQDYGPRFIDINMGCPVNKVVAKGGGSALLKKPSELGHFFRTIKKAISIPLSIKIRTGWDQQNRNALEIVHIAHQEGIEWVAIHGRTRAQGYEGQADWEFIEDLKQHSPLPLIGNGDLHTPQKVKNKMAKTHCDALMLARGPLRSPFIFLESFNEGEVTFTGEDFWEVIEKLHDLTLRHFTNDRHRLVQMRKLIVWFSAGLRGAANFRTQCFQLQTLEETLALAHHFFHSLESAHVQIDGQEEFMMSGHG